MEKKVTIINSRNLQLAASLWQAPSDAIIIMAHGSDGNRQAHGLFPSIASALQAASYNVLTFDFSGHGESDDDVFTTAKAVDDLKAAIQFTKTQGYTRIALFGHSFGSLACLKGCSSDIETMILLGAFIGPFDWKLEDVCSPDQLAHVRERGYLTTAVNDGFRNEVKTDVIILQELREINPATMLSRVTCPVLIIHGDADPLEQEFSAISKKVMPLLSKASRLEIIPGASHTFVDHADRVIELTTNWCRQHFPVK